jgi:hypothetical protein
MTHHQLLGTLAALGAITLSISSAQAQACNATSDCPKSYICSVVNTPMTNCIANGGAGAATGVNDPGNPVSPPTADAGMAAAAGAIGVGNASSIGGSASDPVPTEPGGSAGIQACTTTTVQTKECVALSCTSDADCSNGWFCQTNSITSCSTAPSSGSGTAGAGPAVPATAGSGNVTSDVAAGGSASVRSTGAGAATSTCVVTAQPATCQPKAINPCEVPKDCGPGYDCVDSTVCVCSASGYGGGSSSGSVTGVGGAVSTDAATAGSGAVAAPSTAPDTTTTPECSCGPSGYAACQPQNIACQTKLDCPETWTCSTADAGTTAGTCVSPLSGTAGKGYTVGGDSQSTTTPSVDNTNGTAGSAGTEVGATGSASADGPGNANSNNAATAGAGSVQGGGCQIGHGRASQFGALLLGVLVTLGLRRRRQVA